MDGRIYKCDKYDVPRLSCHRQAAALSVDISSRERAVLR